MKNIKHTKKILVVALSIMLVVLLSLFIVNSIKLAELNDKLTNQNNISKTVTNSKQNLDGVNNTSIDSKLDVLPKGIPDVYGSELQISYDDVSVTDQQKANNTISIMAKLDNSIHLNSEQNERYINILYKMNDGISCEYCCGARSVIFENGKAACGCAHSYAMRGLTKYLITEHGNEFTDKEILSEVGKWKTLFFPGQIQQKAQILEQNGIEVNYINLTTNEYRGIKQGQTNSTMVGGC